MKILLFIPYHKLITMSISSIHNINVIDTMDQETDKTVNKILKHITKILKKEVYFLDILIEYYLDNNQLEIYINYENNDTIDNLAIEKIIINVVDDYAYILIQSINFNNESVFIRKIFLDAGKNPLYIKNIVEYFNDIL